MANSISPTATPGSAPGRTHPGARRSFTLPTRLTDAPRNHPELPSTEAIEILYSHAQAKIVSFNVAIPASSSRPNSSAGTQNPESDSPQRTLIPWAYPSDRTLAAGHLQIHRVPNTGVCFLHSGQFLRHIIAKSQMWCVDGISKFVLKVGPTSFYRIELPADSAEDKAKVEEFKSAVAQILRFEKTPSPFVTGQLQTEDQPATPSRRKSLQPREKAKKWRLNKIWEPEDAEHRARIRSTSENAHLAEARRRDGHLEGAQSFDFDGVASHEGSDERDGSAETSSLSESEAGLKKSDASPIQTKAPVESPDISPALSKSLPRMRAFQYTRSITVPGQITLDFGKSSGAVADTLQEREPDSISIASSHDSFHTVDELGKSISDTASFRSARQVQEDHPVEEDNIVEQFAVVEGSSHSRSTSLTATVPNTPRPQRQVDRSGENRDRSNPSTPTLTSDSGDDATDSRWVDAVTPPDAIRLRRLRKRLPDRHGRLASPPPSVDLFKTSRPPPKMSTVLMQKTYSMLVGPPSHLVALMLRIAARIVQGLPIIYSPLSPHIPRDKMAGTWESSADEEDEWSEDDYGIPLRNYPRKPSDPARQEPRLENLSADWGVD